MGYCCEYSGMKVWHSQSTGEQCLTSEKIRSKERRIRGRRTQVELEQTFFQLKGSKEKQW